MQIDVTAVNAFKNLVACNLYTGERCVKIYMSNSDYRELIRDGFFIRDGKTADSAGVINTSHDYQKVRKTGEKLPLRRKKAVSRE